VGLKAARVQGRLGRGVAILALARDVTGWETGIDSCLVAS